jgi:hypothetical protein
MTTLLEKAFEEARKLSANEQDALGALILEEIADELRWAKRFAITQDKLAELADEALGDLKAGRATPLELPPRK